MDSVTHHPWVRTRAPAADSEGSSGGNHSVYREEARGPRSSRTRPRAEPRSSDPSSAAGPPGPDTSRVTTYPATPAAEPASSRRIGRTTSAS